jgi:hypothetical protein
MSACLSDSLAACQIHQLQLGAQNTVAGFVKAFDANGKDGVAS